MCVTSGVGQHRVGVAAAILPSDIAGGVGVERGLMGPHLPLVQQLLEARPQQTPLVKVLLAAVAAVDDDAAHATGLQQRLVDGEVGEIGHHLVAFGLGQPVLLAALRTVEGEGRVMRVTGERIRRQGIR